MSWHRWLGVAVVSAALLTSSLSRATCMELPTFGCEIVPTFGDCTSPEANVWPPDAPFSYRIGCQLAPGQSADLQVVAGGRVLKAKPEPLRQCQQWGLWVLEEPLPAPGPGGSLTLSPLSVAKPVPIELAVVADAAKAPRSNREPKHDFECRVAPGDTNRIPALPPPPPAAGCGTCAASSEAPNEEPAARVLLMVALAGARVVARKRGAA